MSPDEESAYERAGVSQAGADRAVAGLVEVLRSIDPGRPSLQAIGPGHYASVLRIADGVGLALCTDGVGTKLVTAAQAGRWETVGIDCVAMNVNDLICVGAEPIAMLDYIAVPRIEEAQLRAVAEGLRAGAERAGIEIPGGELAQVGELVEGLDIVGTAVGLVALDSIVTGARVEPGDTVIGLPSSGLHANGYTLARRALDGVPLGDERLGRPLVDLLLEPTEIYVRPALELLRSAVDVRGLAHITGGGLENLLRLEARVGFEIDEPLPVPPVFRLVQELGEVSEEEMWEVFNMGCGLCCVVAAGDEEEALAILRRAYPGARRIGRATADDGVVRRAAPPAGR